MHSLTGEERGQVRRIIAFFVISSGEQICVVLKHLLFILETVLDAFHHLLPTAQGPGLRYERCRPTRPSQARSNDGGITES